MKPQAFPKLQLTKEELEAVARARSKRESTKVDEEWLFLAEFGFYFGWAGIEAVRSDDNFSMEEANTLLAGARKVWSGHLYDHSSAVLFGSIAAQSKKPKQTFTKATADLLKQAKADK